MLFKKKKYIYGDLIKEFRPTLYSLTIQLLQEKLFEAKRSKQSIYNEGSVFIPQTDKFSHLPLTYMAIVKDEVVLEMIRVNTESAQILSSEGIAFIEFDPKEAIVKKGMIYRDNKFTEGMTNE